MEGARPDPSPNGNTNYYARTKKCAMATFSLYSNIATGLLTAMTKNRPFLSLLSRLGG